MTASPHHKREQLSYDGNPGWPLRRSLNELNGDNAVPSSNDDFQSKDNDQPDLTALPGLPALSSVNPQAMQPLTKLPLFCFSEKSQRRFSKTDFGISEFICPAFP